MNSVVHFEMPYDDNKRVVEFYAKAFDWKFRHENVELDSNTC